MMAYVGIQVLFTLNVHKSSMKQHQSVQDPTSQAMIQTSPTQQPGAPLWKFAISHLWLYMAPGCRKLKCGGNLSEFTTFLPTARQKGIKLCSLQNRQGLTMLASSREQELQ